MKDQPKIPEKVPDTQLVPEQQWAMVFHVNFGGEKKTYRINKNRLLIGSALSSDIRLQQQTVSNVHAVVELDESGVARIFDMASETGVYLNDKKILAEELKDGDTIKIGAAVLEYKKMAIMDAQVQVPQKAVQATCTRKLFYDAKEDFRPLILEDERDVIQIFDYPASTEMTLQIVVYWGDVILNVKHAVDDETITIGENRSAILLVPGVFSDFPFVTFDQGAATIQFMDGMSGVVHSGRQVIPLPKLANSKFSLKQNDQIKVQFQDITLFLSYSPVPPSLRRQRVLERDPTYTRIWFTSLATTLAMVLLSLSMERPKPLEVEELPPRVATILFKPEAKQPEPLKPKEIVKEEIKEKEKPVKPKLEVKKNKKTSAGKAKHGKEKNSAAAKSKEKQQDQPANAVKGAKQKPSPGDQGEGKRAMGKEGIKGVKDKPKEKIAQIESKGRPDAPGAQKSDTTTGKGNIEAIFSDIESSISKNLAASGKGAKAASQNLKGYGGFTTGGNGGLGNLGEGTGGGGETQSLSQGLGTKGLGDGASGKGLGAIGSGGNLLGVGRGRPVIQVGGDSETIIKGGLDKGLIDEIIKRYMDAIRYCYVKELNASKVPIRGRVQTRFVISGSGRVSDAGIESSSLANANVERCLTMVLKRIPFPEPAGGGIVEVSYPFSFTPAALGQ